LSEVLTRIIGLGNPLLSDDAAGLHVVRALRQKLAGREGVELHELSLSPPRLAELFAGAERLIIVDSIKTPSGKPGSLLRLRMSGEDILEAGLPARPGPEAGPGIGPARPGKPAAAEVRGHDAGGVMVSHSADLRAAFRLARLMGLSLPQQVWIFAVEAEDVTTFREELSPAVAHAVPALVEKIASLVCEDGNQ
jgi:hydrogenase maturation protease